MGKSHCDVLGNYFTAYFRYFFFSHGENKDKLKSQKRSHNKCQADR